MNRTAYHVIAGSDSAREVLAAFNKSTGWTVRLVPPQNDQSPVTPVREKPDSVCALLRQHPRARAQCQCFRTQLLEHVHRTRQPERRRCPSGLTEIAVPLLIGSNHIATLVGYRACDRPPLRGEIDRLAQRVGWDPLGPRATRLRAAYRRVPLIPVEIQNSHLFLLQVLAQQLGELTRRALLANFSQDPLCIRRAKEFIESHLAESLGLGIVAAQACLCPQQFSRRFKQVTGLTFHQYLVLRRVERAKELLPHADQKLLDVALAAGFQSPATFYRAFKKHTGQSPAHYRGA